MPSKTIHTRIAQGVRKSPKIRNAGQGSTCAGGAEKNNYPTVIAASIYDLKLSEKKGPVVFRTIGFQHGTVPPAESLEKMYSDLFKAYSNMRKLLFKEYGIESISTHAGADNDIAMALHNMLLEVKKMLPIGIEFNIQKSKGAEPYFFEIYFPVEFSTQWYSIEINKVVKKLRSDSPALHNLFLSFLKLFTSQFGVDMWYQGYMASSIDQMSDRIEDMQLEYDMELPFEAKLIQDYKKDIQAYKNGEPAKYQKLIVAAKKYKSSELINAVKRFKRAPEVVQLITEGCKIMQYGYTLKDFRTPDLEEMRESGFFLELDSQTNIVWDFDDSATSEHEQSLDATAHEGVEEPMCVLNITANNKKIDFEKLKEKAAWPGKLDNFFHNANNLINTYISRK